MSRYENVVQLAKAADFDSEAVTGSHRAKHLVFIDQASRALLALLDRVAPSGAAIQITGETGTGKELVARYIHRKSNRSGPFLAVNCGAISEHLAESELFGHEAGSFTGANSRREGWFEAAHGGTLFLDEIGDLPLALQGKLLRVLQEGEVTRIGARKPTHVDVRVVSATNVNLDAAVEAGRFRRDLLYRLNIVPVVLPSLRDRPGDIVALAEHFVGVYGAKLNRPTPGLSADALDKLKRHSWPGNIRELENVVHYALLMSSDGTIRAEDIRLSVPAAALPGSGASVAAAPLAVELRGSTTLALDRQAATIKGVSEALRECFGAPGGSLLRDVERRLVEDAFQYCDSNQVRTAELLGVSRNVVRTLLKRYGLITEPRDAEVEVDLVPYADFDGLDEVREYGRLAPATPIAP
jgi:DNA-binding NtrC family response regulator